MAGVRRRLAPPAGLIDGVHATPYPDPAMGFFDAWKARPGGDSPEPEKKSLLAKTRELEVGGAFGEASEASAAAGEFARAARLSSKAGAHPDASELFLKAKLPLEAARAFEQAGDFASAGRHFDPAGDGAAAQRCFQRASPEELLGFYLRRRL